MLSYVGQLATTFQCPSINYTHHHHLHWLHSLPACHQPSQCPSIDYTHYQHATYCLCVLLLITLTTSIPLTVSVSFHWWHSLHSLPAYHLLSQCPSIDDTPQHVTNHLSVHPLITLTISVSIHWLHSLPASHLLSQCPSIDDTSYQHVTNHLSVHPLITLTTSMPLTVSVSFHWLHSLQLQAYFLHSISQPPVHLCFAWAIELIAHPKITLILSFSWGISSKKAFCTP